MSSTTSKGRLDQVSIGLSVLCAFHCLLLPAFVGALPAITTVTGGHGHFHTLMLVVVVPLSGLALGMGWLRHRSPAVLALGLAGMSIMLLGVTAGHEVLGESGERWATLAGSFLLAVGHFRNYRQCRPTDGCHNDGC